MSNERAQAGEQIEWVAHPPERRRSTNVVTLPCACCCCCCCCLHTIGGIAGAVGGSVTDIKRQAKKLDDSFPFPFRRDEFDDDWGVHPTLLYWMMVLFTIVATSGLYFLSEGARDESDLFIGLLVAVFFLPALQLGASILCVGVIAVCYTDRTNAFRRLGAITAWSLVGSILGIIAMAGICGIGAFLT